MEQADVSPIRKKHRRTPDLTGLTFGKLLVTGLAPVRRRKGGGCERQWECVCECGGKTIRTTYSLHQSRVIGSTPRCGLCCHEMWSAQGNAHTFLEQWRVLGTLYTEGQLEQMEHDIRSETELLLDISIAEDFPVKQITCAIWATQDAIQYPGPWEIPDLDEVDRARIMEELRSADEDEIAKKAATLRFQESDHFRQAMDGLKENLRLVPLARDNEPAKSGESIAKSQPSRPQPRDVDPSDATLAAVVMRRRARRAWTHDWVWNGIVRPLVGTCSCCGARVEEARGAAPGAYAPALYFTASGTPLGTTAPPCTP
jgi:hypothetical protein